MAPRRPRLTLLALLVLGGATLIALHAAGSGRLAAPPLGDPGQWQSWAAARTPPEVAAAITRLAAMALAGWLVLLVAAGCAVRLAPLGRARRALDRLTPLAVRRIVEAAVGATVSMSVVVPGLAAPAGAAVITETAVLRRIDAPVTTVVAPSGLAPAPATPAAAAEPPTDVPATWTVHPGDDLWGIAEQVLSSAWGRAPTDAEVAPYWRELLTANRDRLVTANNPDLVRPGQTFTLPDPPPAS